MSLVAYDVSSDEEGDAAMAPPPAAASAPAAREKNARATPQGGAREPRPRKQPRLDVLAALPHLDEFDDVPPPAADERARVAAPPLTPPQLWKRRPNVSTEDNGSA
eukprot:m51a1_g5889 hypothetical protein (106) ;mRNA; r:524349-524666